MRKLLLLMLLTFISGRSQTQDLANLAKGEYLTFNPIFDSDSNLFAYFILYGNGKSDDTHKKFEYIILDKNLNKIANKEFEAESSVRDYQAYKNYAGDIILNPNILSTGMLYFKNFIYPSSKKIDLKKNEIQDKEFFCYKDNAFYDCTINKSRKEYSLDEKKELKEKGFNSKSTISNLKTGGYLVFDWEDWGKYKKNAKIIRFDENKNKLWEKNYNQTGSKKNSEEYDVLISDEKTIYFLHNITQKKDQKDDLIGIDSKDGSIKLQKKITEITHNTIWGALTNYSQTAKKDWGDKIYILSENYDKKNLHKGFLKLTIDKKTNSVFIDTFSFADDVKKFIKIDKNGGLEKGYELALTDLYILKDGSAGILAEKIKLAKNVLTSQYVPKSTDLVYITTDSNFKIKDVNILEKAKSKKEDAFSDYLFSQYFNNNDNVAFFYKDYQKDENGIKNWNLFINTVVNNKFNQEKIIISNHKKNITTPYLAKEGYILLREYNEKEKYNQIRLEKLNY
jgi:hypothetical protein